MLTFRPILAFYQFETGCQEIVTEKTCLTGVIWLMGWYNCSEPRDYLFAVLALWSKMHSTRGDSKIDGHESRASSLLIADHSLTMNGALLIASRVVCQYSLELSLLSYVHHHQLPKTDGLPSWVPAFNQYTYTLGFEGDGVGACAALHTRSITFEGDGRDLVTFGVVFDEVLLVSPPRRPPDDTKAGFAQSPGMKRVELF
jgi:hypothetical protein